MVDTNCRLGSYTRWEAFVNIRGFNAIEETAMPPLGGYRTTVQLTCRSSACGRAHIAQVATYSRIAPLSPVGVEEDIPKSPPRLKHGINVE